MSQALTIMMDCCSYTCNIRDKLWQSTLLTISFPIEIILLNIVQHLLQRTGLIFFLKENAVVDLKQRSSTSPRCTPNYSALCVECRTDF